MIKEQFQQLKAKVNKFVDTAEEKSQKTGDEAKKKWVETRKDLMDKEKNAESEIEKYEASGKTVSEEIQQGVKRSINELKNSYESAKEKFGKIGK